MSDPSCWSWLYPYDERREEESDTGRWQAAAAQSFARISLRIITVSVAGAACRHSRSMTAW